MKIPSGFRFRSDITLFCQVVDAAQEMIERNELSLLFGFEEDVFFDEFFSEEAFINHEFPCALDDFKRILFKEVRYLVSEILLKTDDITSLQRFLEEKAVPESDREEILSLFTQKLAYVRTHLISVESQKRFDFKYLTTSRKVSEFDWDICKYVFSNGQEQRYAQVKIAVMDDLPAIGESGNDDNSDKIQFVCDFHDINYLIKQLLLIRLRLEEEEI